MQRSFPVGTHHCEPRRRGDEDVGNHPIMDVASQSYEPWRFKDDRFGWGPGVKRQLEFLRGRNRVDMVFDVILIRKLNRTAGLNGADIGDELLVALRNNRACRVGWGLSRERQRVNDGVL